MPIFFSDPTLEPKMKVAPLQSPQKLPMKKIPPKPSPICDWIEKNEKSAKFYTGLYKYQRTSLWNFLGKAKSELDIIGIGKKSGELKKLSIRCQFLMTLLILRRDRCFQDVALQFDIEHETISNVFKTWLQFMFWKFRDIQDQQFTKRKDLPRLPAVFKNKLLKDTR